MSKDTKDLLQYGSAVLMLLSGVVLTFLCFFLNGHDVTDGVLWYVAQTLVYAGSIFGVSIYIRSKMGDAKGKIEDIIKDEIKSVIDGNRNTENKQE